jgi:lysophospholipase L1-like esterase
VDSTAIVRSKKILLALASLAAACFVAELAATASMRGRWERGVVPRLQWLDVGVREPQRGWANRPHLRAELIGKHEPYHVAHDSRGYRQVERSDERAGDVVRVLVLGDSIVYGWGVEAHERFTDRLESRLTRELTRKVEVWNLGVPGYSLDQELWTYELHGRALKPDVVLVCIVMNDVAIAETDSFNGLGKPRLVLRDGSWLRIEAPAELVRPRAMPLELRLSGWCATVAWLRERRATPPLAPAMVFPSAPWSEAAGRPIADAAAAQAAKFLDHNAPVHEALRALTQLVREDGSALVLFSVPFGHDLYLTDPRFGAPPEGRVESSLSRTVRMFAERNGVASVTIDEAFGSDVSRGALLHVGDGHPNARANELIADGVLPTLLEVLASR